MDIKKRIEKVLSTVVGQEVKLEHPTEESHGDYSTNIAMTLAKKQGKKPMELAEEIVGELTRLRQKASARQRGKF